ncbi:MAG: YihY/virulence factor BrkB family protein [Polyangiaceae bacterium]
MIKEAASDWDEDNVSRLAAALSCYMILSIAPLGMLFVVTVGVVYGEEAARGQVTERLQALLGRESAMAIETIIRNAQSPSSGILSTLVGLVIIFFGASGVFVELKSALNQIWRVPPPTSGGVWVYVRNRLASFTMVIAVVVLLLASMVLSAGLALAGKFFEGWLPGGEPIWQLLTSILFFAVTTVIFAAVFRAVPDREIEWQEVWPGAFVTALLFTLGRIGVAMYLGKSSVTSSFGAAGSLVALVIWVYYSSQIVFFGAEFAQVYSRSRGRRLRIERETERAREGAEEDERDR